MDLRSRLVRASVGTVVLSVLLVAVPTLLVALWRMQALADGTADLGTAAWRLVLLVTITTVVAGVVGVVVARRQAAALAAPMTQLAQRAEGLGIAQPRFEQMRSEITEIDRVAEVLQRRAVDVTQRLANEREFASDASHQLRTPLTALLIRLEEISLSDDPETMREEAHICIDQVERLTRVVDDLLRRSRTTPADQVPAVSLDSVLASLQREWQPAFEKARRSIKISGQRELRVLAAPDDLAQILSTLLENSLEHGFGRIEVKARRSGPSVVVEVTDQGEGIEAGLAPHIFERRVTTGGTGLGLALARDLAQSNGGRLELLRTNPALFALFLSEAPTEALT